MPRARSRINAEVSQKEREGGESKPTLAGCARHRMLRFHGDGSATPCPLRHAGDPSQHPTAGQPGSPPAQGGPAALTASGRGLNPPGCSCPSHQVTMRCHHHTSSSAEDSPSCFSSLPRATAEPTAPVGPCGSQLHLPTCFPPPGLPGINSIMSLKCSGNEEHWRKVVRNLKGTRACPAKDGHALLCFHASKDPPEPQILLKPPEQPLGACPGHGPWGFLAHLPQRVSLVPGCAERREVGAAAEPANNSQPIKLSKGNH